MATPSRGGCIILLDVPPGSAVSIDGITRLTPSSSSNSVTTPSSSSPFNNGVIIISGIPSSSATSHSSSGQFHLLVVRCGSTNKNQNQRDCDIRTLPVGFILTPPSPSLDINNSNNDSDYEWTFARRYDPRTEEISNKPIDELTLNNLLLAMREGGELATFLPKNLIMSYDQFMQTSPSSSPSIRTGVKSSISSWNTRTSLIKSVYLHRRHSITHGDKIVPSSYDEDDVEGDKSQTHNHHNSNSNNNKPIDEQDNNVDGKQISYPYIPCIDTTISARRLTQHSGTRSYLSKLSPEIRTKLLLGGGEVNAGEYVWNDILCSVYGGMRCSDVDSSSTCDFLADVQLSFLIFLFLECHTSLVHWRDTISMCSFAVTPTNEKGNNLVLKHTIFFQQLLTIIYDQLLCIETEFFQEDVEYSSGQQNFMIEALGRLCYACDGVVDDCGELNGLKSASLKLKRMLSDRFHVDLSSSQSRMNDDEMEAEEESMPVNSNYNYNVALIQNQPVIMDEECDDDDDGEDGPVIVPYDQVESSLSRSAATFLTTRVDTTDEAMHRQSYPLLYAAMSQQEDVVMCAARILDEKNDVSLVREAAAYLEEVEAHRAAFFS